MNREILFWESLTGERYKLSERGLRHGYMSIDCVFNSKSFYANRQPKQWHLWETSFDLEDDTKWKTMNSSLIGQLSNRQATIGLVVPNWTNQEFFASQWARQLKKEITSKRRVKGLYTTWNRELSFYLLTALNSYEMERLYGISQIDNSFFQESIKRFVPDGHTFKGFPCMFTSQDTCSEALEVLARQELPRSILNLHAPNSQFALAVRCFAYPENICVIWIMLAVSYQTITQ
jgi:centrosomal protein CEP76